MQYTRRVGYDESDTTGKPRDNYFNKRSSAVDCRFLQQCTILLPGIKNLALATLS